MYHLGKGYKMLMIVNLGKFFFFFLFVSFLFTWLGGYFCLSYTWKKFWILGPSLVMLPYNWTDWLNYSWLGRRQCSWQASNRQPYVTKSKTCIFSTSFSSLFTLHYNSVLKLVTKDSPISKRLVELFMP